MQLNFSPRASVRRSPLETLRLNPLFSPEKCTQRERFTALGKQIFDDCRYEAESFQVIKLLSSERSPLTTNKRDQNKNMSTPARTFKFGGDLEVKRLGFGAMRLTGKGIWGEPKDVDEAKRVLKRAVELGVNFIDTADSYGPAVSEPLIGEVLSPFPKGLVVATKGGL